MATVYAFIMLEADREVKKKGRKNKEIKAGLKTWTNIIKSFYPH